MLRPLSLITALIIVGVPFQVNATTIATTTADSLKVRDAPSGEVVTSLPKGSIVAVVEIKGAWVKILYLNKHNSNDYHYGWVRANYLKVISGNKTPSGDDCEYEYDTNAEVCVSVTDVSLDCRKSYDRSYYRGCEVEVEYEVSTNYEGNDYLDVEVECNVDIRYNGRNTNSWRSDSDSDDENHSLYEYGSESGDMSLDFSFSSYREVINVKIDSAECEIDSVTHY